MQKNLFIECEDGTPLAATLFTPPRPRATVMIAPATGIRRQFYTHFASYLCALGFTVMTFDNRGIGDSLNGPVQHSKATLVQWGQLDMQAVLQTLQQAFPGLPHFLAGHSAGGQLAGLMPGACDLSAIFTFGSSSGRLANMRWHYRPKAHFFMNLFIPLTNRLFGHTKSHWVGMGEPLPAGVARQWQQWCNGKGYVETAFGQEVTRHHYYSITCPAFWVLAKDDPIACEKNARDMLRVYRNMPATLKIIDPQTHGVDQIGHMRFFSRQCKPLWSLAADFFEQHLPPARLAG
ncbi:alpha/beta fold hydrolase [Alteromonas sp. ASW11-19]|uniref:Alpha/beta fold hydrolase n=1 Tax=Alteromonas salexigens TaxID=2982530 RepID=A0ABT2VJB7_9ALTE|nr:alpha/beta fold hydrolase [Alteromonas salexigens]MCU7553306.1 alpha/beta fold hydrolase [Alteromonas salexigens]